MKNILLITSTILILSCVNGSKNQGSASNNPEPEIKAFEITRINNIDEEILGKWRNERSLMGADMFLYRIRKES